MNASAIMASVCPIALSRPAGPDPGLPSRYLASHHGLE